MTELMSAPAKSVAVVVPLILLALALIAYCLVDIRRSHGATRGLPPVAWAVVVLVSVPLGAIVPGRPAKGRPRTKDGQRTKGQAPRTPDACQPVQRLRARRNPKSLYRNDGSSLLRSVTRQMVCAWRHAPPREARRTP